MPAYFVVSSSITDEALLGEYLQGAGATLGIVPVKVLSVDTECETIEGDPPGSRTVILEFESKDDFRTWYDSPAYQEVRPKRLAATEGFGVLAQGL